MSSNSYCGVNARWAPWNELHKRANGVINVSGSKPNLARLFLKLLDGHNLIVAQIQGLTEGVHGMELAGMRIESSTQALAVQKGASMPRAPNGSSLAGLGRSP